MSIFQMYLVVAGISAVAGVIFATLARAISDKYEWKEYFENIAGLVAGILFILVSIICC